MRKKITLLLFPLLCPVFNLFAQNATLQGIVTDAATGEPLLGATVKTSSGGASTDDKGVYHLSLPAGNYELEFVYTGFENRRPIVTGKQNLKPHAYKQSEPPRR